MTAIYSAYNELAELMALLHSDKVLALRASEEVQSRYNILLGKAQDTTINEQETDELNHFIVLERLIRLAKLQVDINSNTIKVE